MDVKAIGERIRDRRTKQNLSLRQLAERIKELTGTEISHAFIGKLELGERQKVDVGLLGLVAAGLGVELSELLGVAAESVEAQADRIARQWLSLSEAHRVEALNYMKFLEAQEAGK